MLANTIAVVARRLMNRNQKDRRIAELVIDNWANRGVGHRYEFDTGADFVPHVVDRRGRNAIFDRHIDRRLAGNGRRLELLDLFDTVEYLFELVGD